MAAARISFLFPIRWMTGAEDKKFLGTNLINMIKRQLNDYDLDSLRLIPVYTVVIKIVSYKPLDISLTEKQVTTLLKPLFKHGKCIEVLYEFSQSREKKMLPVVDFQIYC